MTTLLDLTPYRNSYKENPPMHLGGLFMSMTTDKTCNTISHNNMFDNLKNICYSSRMVDELTKMYRTLETIGIAGQWGNLIVDDTTGDIYTCNDTLSSLTGIGYWTVHTVTYPVISVKVTVETPHGIIIKSVYSENYLCDFLKKFKPDMFRAYVQFLSDFCQYPLTYLD